MRHEHVQRRAGRVVEPCAVGDVERLGHVDLDLGDELGVPDPTEEPVGEPQQVQVLSRLFAEEVIDAVDLLLVEGLPDERVELGEALGRGPVRLLVHRRGARVQLVGLDRLRGRRKGRRRDGEIVDDLRIRPEVLLRLVDDVEEAAGIVGSEAAAREEQVLGEGRPRVRLRRLGEFGERVVEVAAEVLVGDVAPAVADELPPLRQQTAFEQLVERREDHAFGQVAGRAVEDEDGRFEIFCHAPHAMGPVWTETTGGARRPATAALAAAATRPPAR